MARRNRRKKGKNKHHIVCRSRCCCHQKANIVVVNATNHALLHELFGNQLPNEIVKFLVDNYWNGQWNWVEQALRENSDESTGNGHL